MTVKNTDIMRKELDLETLEEVTGGSPFEEKFGDNHPGPNIVWGVNGPDRPKIGVFEITE